MNDMSSHFTPAQILDAAQRAEADGQIDFALRYYRHLFDVYRASPEGTVAGDALSRLGRSFGEGGPAGMSGVQGGYQHGGRWSGPPQARGGEKATDRGRARRGKSARRQDNGGSRRQESSRGYFAGRALAMMITWSGVLAVLLGCGLLASMVANVTVLLDLLGIVPGFAGAKNGMLVLGGGCAMIFVGQVARAVFEIAGVAREIADLQYQRVEMESQHDAQGDWR